MPNNNLEDDSGSLFEEELDNTASNNVNQIIIKLKNASSDQKTLVINYLLNTD